MGLFSRKNTSKASTEEKKVSQANADDIWNTPVASRGSEAKSAYIKEGKYDEVKSHKLDENLTIEPEVIKSKMVELEKELEEKNSKPVKTYADYDTNPVQEKEVTDAQTEYEKLYETEHAKFLASHKEDIDTAKTENLENKMQDMYSEHDRKQSLEKSQYANIKEIGSDETQEKMSGLSYAKKLEDYAEYKDIKGVSAQQSEIDKLGTIDHSGDEDNIGDVSQDLLDQKISEFNEKYKQ